MKRKKMILKLKDGKKKKIENSMEWLNVEYTDENGIIKTGWVVAGYLKEIEEVEKVVDTNEHGGINLNVRKSPGVKSEKIADIENGTKIKISEFELARAVETDKKSWIKITLPDGTEGYVCSDYIKDEEATVEILTNNKESNEEKKNDSKIKRW